MGNFQPRFVVPVFEASPHSSCRLHASYMQSTSGGLRTTCHGDLASLESDPISINELTKTFFLNHYIVQYLQNFRVRNFPYTPYINIQFHHCVYVCMYVYINIYIIIFMYYYIAQLSIPILAAFIPQVLPGSTDSSALPLWAVRNLCPGRHCFGWVKYEWA